MTLASSRTRGPSPPPPPPPPPLALELPCSRSRAAIDVIRRREVPLRKCAAGAGLQVALETCGCALIGELEHHDDGPRSMLTRIAIWPRVVPVESFVDVRRAAHVMPRGISVAAKDVDESSSKAAHVLRRRIFRASFRALGPSKDFWD